MTKTYDHSIYRREGNERSAQDRFADLPLQLSHAAAHLCNGRVTT